MINVFGFVFLICGVCTALAADREFGHPLFRTFTAHDYGEVYEIYAVAEDAQGRMLFGCQDTILAFDNNRWEAIPAPGTGYIRWLKVDGRGVVWFGSSTQIGYRSRVPGHYRLANVYSDSVGPPSPAGVAGGRGYFRSSTGLIH